MTKEINISIITPVYNTYKQYLLECFESLLNIDYDKHEIIVVDDGSNKETKDILEQYNDKFKIVHQENGGIIAARKKGLSLAQGEYILYIDSDDIIDINALKVLDEIIGKYHPDVINHDNFRFKKSIKEITFRDAFLQEGIVEKDKALEELSKIHIQSIGNKIVRKELYDDMWSHINTKIINGEDFQQSTYVLLKANKIYHTSKPIDYYRINEVYRDYYGDNTISDINYTLPAYNMLFLENNGYEKFLPLFLNASINSIIYTGFKLCNRKVDFDEKKRLLNLLNEQEVTKTYSQLNVNLSFVTKMLFTLLIKKHYLLFNVFAHIYKIAFGLDKSTNQ